MPDFLKGVINLRGKVTPVIEVRSKFHQKTIDYTDRTCVIIVSVQNKEIGLIVDYVK